MRKIRAIFIFTLLVFAILPTLYAERIQCVWTGIERIVAVGDLHGDYEVFINILKVNKIIDEEKHWIAGKTHLVQIGDIFDRGGHAKSIMDFLMILENEAEQAGGKVHALIGNHEFMNIAGVAFDQRGYIFLDQFVSFLPKEYVEEMEMKFRQNAGENSPRENNSDHFYDPDLETEWLKLLGDVLTNKRHPARLKYSRNLLEIYGEWLFNKNTVIKINDTVFVHGGLNEKYSKRNLEKLNESIRKEMKSVASAAKSPFRQNVRAPISYDTDGPLWYRDLAQIEGSGFEKEVDRILENLKAKHMVIAHTPQLIKHPGEMQRYNKKIWIIDTGNSSVYINGRESALRIENGEFYVWLGEPRKGEAPSLEYTKQFQVGSGTATPLFSAS